MAFTTADSRGAVANRHLPTKHLVINRVIALVWSDQYLADAIADGRIDWQAALAGRLSIGLSELRQAIKDYGLANLKAVLVDNPAGDAPAPAYTSGALGNMRWSNQACQQTAAACPSGQSCGSCWCQSGQCIVLQP
jgi:hypothetical protein